MEEKQQECNNEKKAGRKEVFKATVMHLMKNEKRRFSAIRYLIPVVFVLLTAILFVLPMIEYTTAAGTSDAKSLLYWYNVSFFGNGSSKGAYELLLSVSANSSDVGFYRAVVVSYIVGMVLFVLGAVLTVVTSVSALYLLATEEKTPKSHRVGQIFRLLVGNRAATAIPYFMTTLPFLYSRLLAYYYTYLLLYDTNVTYPLIDPLVIAVCFSLIDLILIFSSRSKERYGNYDIFGKPKTVSGDISGDADALREWEEAVRADAANGEVLVEEWNNNGEFSEQNGIEVKEMTNCFEDDSDKKAPPEVVPNGDELFDREFVIEERAIDKRSADVTSQDAEGLSVYLPEKVEDRADGNSTEAEEMRNSIRALFAENEDNDLKSKRKKKR